MKARQCSSHSSLVCFWGVIMTPLSMSEQFLYLTTTGRTSGLPREIEIWFVEADGKYYILAEKFHDAHWLWNIQKNPRVHVRVADRPFGATARALARRRAAG